MQWACCCTKLFFDRLATEARLPVAHSVMLTNAVAVCRRRQYAYACHMLRRGLLGIDFPLFSTLCECEIIIALPTTAEYCPGDPRPLAGGYAC